MDQLLQSSADHSKTIIQVGTDIAGKKEGDNEHVWYIPQVMPQLATVIADKLSELDPGNAEDYHRHASDYIASLAPLQELIDKLKQREPVTVGVSEPVFNYMLDALNFRANNDNFPLAIEKGIDPAPADFAHMQDDLKNKKVRFLVQNLQAESPTVAHLVQMAQEHDVPILKVTETIPEGKNYSTWMSEQLKQIERIMDTHQ
jgi:zinc/manganese transport system substrate-binding protein